MARSRNIKPGLFKNEILGVADPIYTIIFQGLWVLADKEGRLEDRPLRIKAEIIPYREGIDVDIILNWLACNRFIERYKVNENNYIQVINFRKHQNPHKKEADSTIPVPEIPGYIQEKPVQIQENPDQAGLIPDSRFPIPDSLIPEKDLLSDSPESDQKEKIDDEIVYFVTGFQNAVAENHGAKAPRITDSLIKNGSSCIDKLIRLDGFEKEEVFNAIRWAYKDSFWSNQVFSMASLRTKGKNGLMKFQNIMNSMQIRPQSITGSPRTDQNIRAAMEFINDGR